MVGTKGHSGGAREGAGSGGARQGAGRPEGAIDVMPRERGAGTKGEIACPP
jgi:hypothetical protein